MHKYDLQGLRKPLKPLKKGEKLFPKGESSGHPSKANRAQCCLTSVICGREGYPLRYHDLLEKEGEITQPNETFKLKCLIKAIIM